jgi:hypothetical protein
MPNPSPLFSTMIQGYRGTSLIRKRTPLGPYSRPMRKVLEGGAVSYERGTPVPYMSGGGSMPKPSPFLYHDTGVSRIREPTTSCACHVHIPVETPSLY